MPGNGEGRKVHHMSDTDPVVFCTRTNRIIEFVERYGEAATALSALMTEYGPDLIVLPMGDAHSRYENAFKSPPVEVSQERYWDMLEILPPVGFVNTGQEESFKLSERTAGHVTAILARIGERYFEMSDSILMKHADIIAAVRGADAFTAPNRAPTVE